MLGFLVQWNLGWLYIFPRYYIKIYIELNKYYAEKFSETADIGIKIQHWGGNRKFSMEGIAVEYFPNSVDQGKN